MIKNLISKNKTLIKYGLISVFVTVIDIIITRICENYTNEVTANTVGVFTGFILQCILCMKIVFNDKGLKSILVFFATWLFGLGLADLIVYIVRNLTCKSDNNLVCFFAGKSASIVIPFFVLYFIRRKLLRTYE